MRIFVLLSVLVSAALAAILTAGCGGKADKKTPAATETANTEIEMVFVEGGTFTMGCTAEQGGDCGNDEKPAHIVTVSEFYIGKYPVTQAQWMAVMDSNPSEFTGDGNLPIENVSLGDARAFIRKLNAKSGKTYRLPTEAEWEFAARGGKKSNGYRYSGGDDIDDVAWYDGNSGGTTRPVGAKAPNELGLYDMSGNVREFVNDRYGDDYYGLSLSVNPTGPLSRSFNDGVTRGGSWGLGAESCRVSARGVAVWWEKDDDSNTGFRIVLSPATEADSGGVWMSFRGGRNEADKFMRGYMNRYGNVMIEPVFNQLPSPCHMFDNIVGVSGKIDGKVVDHYLTKTGKIVGIDSLHIFEMSADCETEGFIRFSDNKTDRVGLFDRNGNVAIAAEYSHLGRVINGMILALKGGEISDVHDEHWTWAGGTGMLIDTLNNVLIEDIGDIFSDFSYLDFFSLEITEAPHPDTTRVSFRAKDGTYYSFVDFEKEFNQWLAKDLLPSLAADTLNDSPKDSFTWQIGNRRGNVNRREFVSRNFETLRKELAEGADVFIESYIYRDYSGNTKERLYPSVDVRGALKSERGYKNAYSFSRDGGGYKLTGVCIFRGGLGVHSE